MIDIKIH